MTQYCGYIGLMGRPNTGKSTLLNSILGQKIAGVGAKPQTTRNQILGIATHENTQLLFLDTPGIHRTRNKVQINSLMNRTAWTTIEEADLIIYLIDATDIDKKDFEFLENILVSAQKTDSDVKVKVVLSKSDRLKKNVLGEKSAQVETHLKEIAAKDGGSCLHSTTPSLISSKRREVVQDFLAELAAMLPENPWLFDEEELTDRPQKFVCSELIREQVFRCLGDEIPYCSAVRIDSFKDRSNGFDILATVIVSRNSQKGMVIGKKGSKIKEIGIKSRSSLEQHLGGNVYLDLNVSVEKDWVNNVNLTHQLMEM